MDKCGGMIVKLVLVSRPGMLMLLNILMVLAYGRSFVW